LHSEKENFDETQVFTLQAQGLVFTLQAQGLVFTL
jgi:hypothetical protein